MKTIKEVYNYREMIFSLVRKELRGKYKGSVLGFLWTFINPLCQLIIYTVLFTKILVTDIDKYYLFLFVGLIPWIFFSSCLTGGAGSVMSQQSLVTKIYFPREVLPISFVTSAFVNMLLCFIIVFGVVIFAGIHISFFALLCLPVIMLIEYFMALGIAFFASAITVFFRDMEHILGVLSMMWMYMTPILYSLTLIPESKQWIFYLNPMTAIIESYRDILYYGVVPQMNNLLISVAFTVGVLLIGVLTFERLKRKFAEEL